MSSQRFFTGPSTAEEDLFFDQLFSDDESSPKRNLLSQPAKHYVPPPPSFSQLLFSQRTISGSQNKNVSPRTSQSRTVAKVPPQKSIRQLTQTPSSSWQTFSNSFVSSKYNTNNLSKEPREVISISEDTDHDFEEYTTKNDKESRIEDELYGYGHGNDTANNRFSLQTPSQMTLTAEQFRSIFSAFPYFNFVQSKVLDDVLYTDKPVVVCSPTGSGKTVVFELAIIRLMMNVPEQARNFKIVYMAPMKALCSERHEEWSKKFTPLGLACKELTGDSEMDDYLELQKANIVMTTPEKWDSMTRKWKDNRALVQAVRLFLIDEVHLLNDESRGPTMEAVISRMKTVRTAECRASHQKEIFGANMRFLAISATIPNTDDIGAWLGTAEQPAVNYSMDDSYRPVKLRKVVLGYTWTENMSNYRFDFSLNYKLSSIVHTYSDGKPTLVFCSTRKGAQQAGSILIKDARFIKNSEHRQRLQRCANSIHDSKLRELMMCGVAYHHAGLDVSDRRLVESLFTRGDLPVLFATSTLAMGVNLPAHLVIIKSTTQYVKGVFEEYAESQILQMIGRAGRPQFDDSATAVIMTKNTNKMKYEAIMGGTQNVESCLHKNLIEHLNAEIVLNTITDVSIALEWLKSSFLYIRILKNPTYYGIPENLDMDVLEKKLQEMCVESLNTLGNHGLVHMVEGFDLRPSDTGKLMARFYIAFESMKLFLGLQGTEELNELVAVVCQCKEFSDLKIRNNEKKVLNTLNKDKNRVTIRFPINGKIKTTEQKINCLIQATFGCLPINEFALNQDVTKIFRSGQRVTKCLYEFCMLQNNYNLLMNALQLSKCFRARLWENSKHVSKQLEKVGLTMSTMLVNAGLTTFQKIEETNPREIELIVNRHPPFGNQIREAAASLPKYEVDIEQKSNYSLTRAELVVTITMVNYIKRNDCRTKATGYHYCVLLIGDADNKIVHKQRLADAVFFSDGTWSRKIEVQRASQSSELRINVISQDIVGVDMQKSFTPYYTGPNRGSNYRVQNFRNIPPTPSKENGKRKQTTETRARQPCNHKCINKHLCAHECCKNGALVRKIESKETRVNQQQTKTGKKDNTSRTITSNMDSFMDQLHARNQAIPATPGRKRLTSHFDPSHFDFERPCSPRQCPSPKLARFEYKPRQKYQYHAMEQVENIVQDFEDSDWQDMEFYDEHDTTDEIELIDLTKDILNDDMEEDDWDYQYNYLEDNRSQRYDREDQALPQQPTERRFMYNSKSASHFLSKDPSPKQREANEPNFYKRNERSMTPEIAVPDRSNPFPKASTQKSSFFRTNNPRPSTKLLKENVSTKSLPPSTNLNSREFVTATQVVEMKNRQPPKALELDNIPTATVDKSQSMAQPPSTFGGTNRRDMETSEEVKQRKEYREMNTGCFLQTGQIAGKKNTMEKEDAKSVASTFHKSFRTFQEFFNPFSNNSDHEEDENHDAFKNIFSDVF